MRPSMAEEPNFEARSRSKSVHPDQVDSQMGSVRVVRGAPREIKELREMDRIAADIRSQREKK